MKRHTLTPDHLTSVFTLILAGLCLWFSASPVFAATYKWLGGTDDNWSTGANWDIGSPPASGDDARFYDDDATGTPGPSGTPNSIVDTDQELLQMQFRNTNGFHTVQIPSGRTLSILGTTTVNVNTLYSGTGTDAGGDQTVYGSVVGPGVLAVTNTWGTIYVRQGSATAGAHRATLDLSGLDTFNYVGRRILIGGEGSSTAAADGPSGHLILARTNFIALSGSTSNIVVGACASNGATNWLTLGQDNVILNDDGMTVGGRKCVGLMSFNPALPNSRAVFRNLAGDGPQAYWYIGDDYLQGGGSGSTGIGTSADLTGGTVDAQVTTLIVGRGQSKVNSAGSIAAGGRWGTLAFDAGEIATSTMEVGQRGGSSAGNASGRVSVGNTARLIVTNNLRLGYTPTTATTCSSTLSLTNGGFVWVMGNIIDGGLSTNVINVSGAGSHLKVGGYLGRDYGVNERPLDELNLTNATLTLTLSAAITPDNPVGSVTNLNIATALTINLEGAGFGFGQYPLIKYYSGAIGGDGYPVVSLGTEPPGAQGYLSNNTARASIDYVVTNVLAAKWTGAVNGDWDIATTANWVDSISGTPTTYQQTSIPGSKVLFDDSATGTTTVNLTTTLSPELVTVANSSKTYTFSEAGSLSGPGALVKNGSGTLVLNNSGINDFIGGAFINAGKLQLGLADDRLPIAGNVALADAAGAALDLGGFNQTLGSLTGGGPSGGNIDLRAGTLTTTAAGIYDGAISGTGMFRKTGSGTQTLGGANTYAGGTYIEGTVTLANPAGYGLGTGPVEIASGTLNVGNGAAANLFVGQLITNYGSLVFNATNDLTVTQIHGTGTVTKNNAANRVTITGTGTYTGATTIYDGTLRITDGLALGDPLVATTIRNTPTARLELVGDITVNEHILLSMKQSTAGLVAAIVNVSGTNTLSGLITGDRGGSYWTFQSDAGKLIVNGTLLNNVNAGEPSCLRFLGAADGDWATDLPVGVGLPPKLRKEGSGTWTLSKDTYYTGDTLVYEGTLLVDGSIQSSSAVYVGFTNTPTVPAILGGSGTINALVIVSTNGIISPGAPASIGTLSIYNNLTTSGTCRFDLNTDTLACDQLGVAGTATYGGTLEIRMSGGAALTPGTYFQLFNAGSRSGAFDAIAPLKPGPGLSWDTSQLTVDGTLGVIAAVTPPAPTIAPVTLAGTNLVVSVPTVTGASYVLQSATNLTPPIFWVNESTNAGTGGDLILNVPVQPDKPQKFLRFVVY